MNKRRTLIALDALGTGGEERAAIEMLSSLRPEKYSVDLLMLHPEGDLMKEIPRWVNVVPVPFTKWGRLLFERGRNAGLAWALKHARIDLVLSLLVKQYFRKSLAPNVREWRWLREALDLPSLPNVVYDVAMTYCSQQAMHHLVAECIRAKRKVVWFHCEVDRGEKDYTGLEDVWSHYDVWAYAASDRIRADYAKMCPRFEHRLVRMPLLVNVDRCRKMSVLPVDFAHESGVYLLYTVGRLTNQKGIDLAIRACRKLRDDGLKVRWLVAGNGINRVALEQQIKQNGLEDVFVLLGNLPNPYPYYRLCDVYVQPSRWEGYCITLAEARIFGKPIVCTDFSGAKEQVVDKVSALVVSPNADDIYAAIKRMLSDVGLRESISANVAKSSENAMGGIQRIERLLDGASLEELRREQ